MNHLAEVTVFSISLCFAKEHMNYWTWEKCYKTTVQQLKIAEVTHAKKNMQFRNGIESSERHET